MLVYFAGPLFSMTERKVNRALAKALKAELGQNQIQMKALLPQTFKPDAAALLAHGGDNWAATFQACVDGVVKADLVVANLDGCDSDSGTCWEMGYAFALGKPIIGVRTDYRPNQDHGMNIMPARSCTRIVHRLAFDESIDHLAKDVSRAIKAVLKKGLPESVKAAPEPAHRAKGRKVYWSGPVFSLTDRKTNRALGDALAKAVPELHVHLPQDFKQKGRFNDPRSFGSIFLSNCTGLDASDLIVAVLDGCDTDTGTSWEVGYAYGKGKPVIGLRTDTRQQQEQGLNLMLARGLTHLVYRTNFDENLRELVVMLAKTVAKVLPPRPSAALN